MLVWWQLKQRVMRYHSIWKESQVDRSKFLWQIITLCSPLLQSLCLSLSGNGTRSTSHLTEWPLKGGLSLSSTRKELIGSMKFIWERVGLQLGMSVRKVLTVLLTIMALLPVNHWRLFNMRWTRHGKVETSSKWWLESTKTRTMGRVRTMECR